MSEPIDQLLTEASLARRDGRSSDACAIMLDVVLKCRVANDRRNLAVALKALGQAERNLGNLAIARGHYEEAAAIYRCDGPVLALAHTVRHVGDIYLAERNYALAEPCYREALDLYRSHAETGLLDLANTLRGLAILKDDVGEKEESIVLWREAGELYAAVGVESGVEESRRRIALL